MCALSSFALYNGFRDASWGWETTTKALTPIVLVALGMWMNLGNPLNWWRPFFGTLMTVNKDKIVKREQAGEIPDAIQKEILAWTQEMAKSRFYRVNPYTYKFLKRGDAAMFKLTWG